MKTKISSDPAARFKNLSALISAAAFLYLTAAAIGAEIDQSQLVIDVAAGPYAVGGGSAQVLAQVVTSGRSGFLTGVGLPIAGYGTLLLRIEGVTGNTPNGVVLASQEILGSTLPTFAQDLTGFRLLELSTPLNVSAGERFALVLSAVNPATDSFGLLEGPPGDPYPGGNAYFDSRPNPLGVWVPIGDFAGSDLPFETFVEAIPEPGALTLAAVGACLVAGVQWSRRWRRPAYGRQLGLMA